MTDRAQMTTFPIQHGIAIAFIVVLVNASAAIGEIDEVKPGPDACMGVFGCGGLQAQDMIVLIGLAVCISLIVGITFYFRGRRHNSNDQNGITVVKEQYVNGDIETVLELEEILEDEMEDND